MSDQDSQRVVALLRSVNVGGMTVGGVKLRMAPLRALARDLGWQTVESHIASGNLVFSAEGGAAALAEDLRAAIKARFGVETPILGLRAAQLSNVLADHPWTPHTGHQSHVCFCWHAPDLDDALYHDLRAATEQSRVIGGHVHFLAPDGVAGHGWRRNRAR